VIRQRFLPVQDCLFCQNGLLKYRGATVTIQRSPILHGQNESRGTIALPTNRDPSATWHTPGGGFVPPAPCCTMPAQGLAAALSPCALQPYFNPRPNGWSFQKGMSHESSLTDGSFQLC